MLRRLGYIFCLLLIFLFIPTRYTDKVRDGATRLTAPLSRFLVQKNVQLTNFAHSIAQISELRDQNRTLQDEVITLQQKLAAADTISRENEALRSQLGVTGVSHDLKKVFGRVIIPENSLTDRTYLVDVGGNQGIKLGQPAVYQGYLVGRVINVRDNSSLIRSITSQQSQVQAWITDSHEKGLLVGTGNAVKLTDITQGVKIDPGTVVETSGLGGSLPPGILIGQIGATESKKSELSQTFSVDLVHDPGSLDSVFILITDGQ